MSGGGVALPAVATTNGLAIHALARDGDREFLSSRVALFAADATDPTFIEAAAQRIDLVVLAHAAHSSPRGVGESRLRRGDAGARGDQVP